jgi:hypothetical protein
MGPWRGPNWASATVIGATTTAASRRDRRRRAIDSATRQPVAIGYLRGIECAADQVVSAAGAALERRQAAAPLVIAMSPVGTKPPPPQANAGRNTERVPDRDRRAGCRVRSDISISRRAALHCGCGRRCRRARAGERERVPAAHQRQTSTRVVAARREDSSGRSAPHADLRSTRTTAA